MVRLNLHAACRRQRVTMHPPCPACASCCYRHRSVSPAFARICNLAFTRRLQAGVERPRVEDSGKTSAKGCSEVVANCSGGSSSKLKERLQSAAAFADAGDNGSSFRGTITDVSGCRTARADDDSGDGRILILLRFARVAAAALVTNSQCAHRCTMAAARVIRFCSGHNAG